MIKATVYAMQRCVWTLAGCRLVAERGFWFSVDVKEQRVCVNM